jgi:cold shock CspA family protein
VTTLTGTLRWWKDEKGYGRGLKQGQRVQFEWEGATGGRWTEGRIQRAPRR